ncbi:MAG TPA: pyridoxal phosphate-dependent aminotransferase family protein [Verrucomicrobiae bacterium]|jgi:7-keto-8-aminopelargonate synthetase-like enzyme
MNDELRQVDRTCVMWRGRRLSYFAGCDYFRLSSHPSVLQALKDGLDRDGLNVAASRMTTGNHPLFTRLEKALADFFGAPAALLAATGYAGNLIAMQALREDFSHILMDERAHLSLRDAARFFSGPVLEFPHRSPAGLTRQLRRLRGKSKPLVLTDGLFSRDGEVAPLAEYVKALPSGGMILLDDAHAAGLLGARGQGTVEYAMVPRRRIIQTVTLSKAFGCYGGAILCEAGLRKKLMEASALFAGSTPLPLPLGHAALKAMELLRSDPGLRCRMSHNVNYIKTALRAGGMDLARTPAPIVPIVPRGPAEIAKTRRHLLAHGVFPSFIRYPGGPAGGYFRFVVSSEHSQKQLDDLLAALRAR